MKLEFQIKHGRLTLEHTKIKSIEKSIVIDDNHGLLKTIDGDVFFLNETYNDAVAKLNYTKHKVSIEKIYDIFKKWKLGTELNDDQLSAVAYHIYNGVEK